MRIQACLFLIVPTLLALTAQVQATAQVSLEVVWVDWPNVELARSAQGKEAAQGKEKVYRDQTLERQVMSELRQIFAQHNIATVPSADVSVHLHVSGMRVIKKYTDSLFGTVRNRPTKYKGQFTVSIRSGEQQVSKFVDKFSINPGFRTVGDTVAVAQAKVRGMIGRWFEKHVQKNKFRKHL